MNRKLLFLLFLFLLLVILNSGCNLSNKEIIAKGKSENWEITITYKLKGNMLYSSGNMVYQKDNPPKKIETATVHPNNFPVGEAGTIEVYVDDIKEHKFSEGGGSLNYEDNYENLKERIDEMSFFIQWEIDGKVFKETVDLSVNK